MDEKLIISNLEDLNKSLAESTQDDKAIEYYNELILDQQNTLYFIKKARLCYCNSLMKMLAHHRKHGFAEVNAEADAIFGSTTYQDLSDVAYQLEDELQIIGVQIQQKNTEIFELKNKIHQAFTVQPL